MDDIQQSIDRHVAEMRQQAAHQRELAKTERPSVVGPPDMNRELRRRAARKLEDVADQLELAKALHRQVMALVHQLGS